MIGLLIERINGRSWHIENLIEVEPDSQVVLVSEVELIIKSLSKKLEGDSIVLADLQGKMFKINWLMRTASGELTNTPLFDQLTEILEGAE